MITVFNTSAQKNSQITLKNGSVIIGEVIINTDSIVKIKTKDNSIWHYSREEVVTVQKMDHTNTKGKVYSILSVGIMPAQNLSRSFHIINGYRINSHWQLGIGIGIENVTSNYYQYNSYAPLFFHGQYNLLKSNTTPFLAVIAGYEMALNNSYSGDENNGGFTTGAKVGLNHYFSDHIGLTTSFGYRYGYFKQTYTNNWWFEPTKTITEINRFEFRFGIVFK
jgi:hypothetical protein